MGVVPMGVVPVLSPTYNERVLVCIVFVVF